MFRTKLASAIGASLLLAGLAAPSAQAAINVDEWTFDLSSFFGNAAGTNQVTKVNALTFNGLFSSNTTDNNVSGAADFGDTQKVDGLLAITSFVTGQVPSVRTFTDDLSKVLGLHFEVTASFSVPNFIYDGAGPGDPTVDFTHLAAGALGVDGLLDIWVDTTPLVTGANTNPNQATSGTGFENGTKIATFKVLPGEGGSFNVSTRSGSDDAKFELVSALPGILLDKFGNDLAAGALLGITDSNTDADPDDNGLRDTTVPGAPAWFGACGATVFSNCGTEDGSFVIAVPEPTSLALLGIGLLGLGRSVRRRG